MRVSLIVAPILYASAEYLNRIGKCWKKDGTAKGWKTDRKKIEKG